MPETLLRFAHISDTHLSADPHYNSDGAPHTPLIGAKALVHQINKLDTPLDFVLHTGDVAFDPDETAYETAREVLSEIRVPVYYLVGNHDYAVPLQRVLLGIAEPKAPYDYEFEVNGVQFICLDSNRPALPYRGKLSDEQFAWLEGLCSAPDDRPLIVALHHPALLTGVPVWDEKMSLVDGERFHQTLLRAKNRLRGVFSGHVHQNVQIVRDGIPYFSSLSSWYQMQYSPEMTSLEKDTFGQPGFSVVQVMRDQLTVQQHRYIVDAGSLTD